jgi:hypothetical protein
MKMNIHAKKTDIEEAYVTCIDLPGEAVQCWSNKAKKVKVILRKHRDMLFDIDFGTGESYCLYSEASRFYVPVLKRLISPGERVAILDGVPLNVWIGRKFKGKLVVVSARGRVGEYIPEDLDVQSLGSDPGCKPAPIFVVMGKSKQRDDLVRKDLNPFHGLPGHSGNLPPSDYVQIVEIKTDGPNVPQEILNFLKHGGEKELLPSGGVITFNWAFNQVVAQMGYSNDNASWIKSLWKEKITLRAIKHKKAGWVLYAILTGNPRARDILRASKWRADNFKLLSITFGAGSATGIRHASWEAVKGITAKGGLLTIGFLITIDYLEWLKDYEQKDPVTGERKKDIADLFIKISLDIGKGVIGTALAAATTGLVLTALGGLATLAAGGLVLTGLLIVVGTVAIALAVGYGLDYLDQKTGASDFLGKKIKKGIVKLRSSAPLDYAGYEEGMTQALIYGGLGA